MQPQPPNLVNAQNTVVSPQVVSSSSVTGLSAAAAVAAAAIGGAVPDDDKCSVTSASAVPGNTPYSTETASTAASVGQYMISAGICESSFRAKFFHLYLICKLTLFFRSQI